LTESKRSPAAARFFNKNAERPRKNANLTAPQPASGSGEIACSPRRPSRLVLALALVAMLLIWSCNYIVGKITLRHLDPFTLVGFRFPVAAAVALSIYFSRRNRTHPHLRDLWTFIYLGFFGILINQGCFTIGLNFTSSEHSAIMVALAPLFVLFFAWVLRLENLTAGKAFGMLISIFGAVLLERGHAASGHSPTLLGDAITLCGVTGFATYTVLGKRVAGHYDAISMTAFNIVVAAILVSPLAVHQALHLDWAKVGWAGWTGMLYMAALSSTTAYMMFYWILRYMDASRVVVLNYCQPVLVVLLSMPILGERPTRNFILGSALVLLGVYMAEHVARRKRALEKI
jgi:drug/metabolite transporter (DMT)-like permease